MTGNPNQTANAARREPVTEAPGKGVRNRGRASPRRAARLAAVQALYQIDIAGGPVTRVIDQFLGGQDLPVEVHRPRARAGARKASPKTARLPRLGVPEHADRELFQAIVGGAMGEPGIDEMIEGGLSDNYSLARIEAVLRAILRAAVFELARDSRDTPPKVVISEYVSLSESFFNDREPALVNAVLDRLARTLNPEAFQARADLDADDGARDL